MSLSSIVKERILSFEPNFVFTTKSFKNIKNKNVVDLVLSRLCKDLEIKRLSKGIYVRTCTNLRTSTPPPDLKIVEAIADSIPTGDYALYKLGIKKDPSRNFALAVRGKSRKIEISGLQITLRRRNKELKTRHKTLLLILEGMKQLGKTKTDETQFAINQFTLLIKDLSVIKRVQLTRLALQYPPFVRALLGAILEEIDGQASEALFQSLNPSTRFKIALSENTHLNRKKWRLFIA